MEKCCRLTTRFFMVPRTQHKKAHSLTAVLSFLRKLHLVLGTNKCKFILKQEMLLSLLNKSKAAEWRAFNFWGTTVYATWYFLEPVKKEREGKKPLTIQCDSKDLFCCSFFFFFAKGEQKDYTKWRQLWQVVVCRCSVPSLYSFPAETPKSSTPKVVSFGIQTKCL